MGKKLKVQKAQKAQKFDKLDFSKVIINLMGRKFSMMEKDDKKDVPVICDLIISKARQGDTLSMILFQFGIRQSLWVKFLRRNRKEVQRAIDDATVFHKAYGQAQLAQLARLDSKDTPNPQIVKLFMSNFYDIREEYTPPISKDTRPGGRYKVITTMTKEVVEGEEHGESDTVRTTE